MRQHISDVATRMFMEQGFDNVRVSDVAKKCGVSEKTIFNYFPNKETLVLDQEEPMTERLRERIGPGATESPADAMIELVHETVEMMIGHGLGSGEMEAMVERFMAMIDSTPALQAARDGAGKRLTDAAAESLASRFGREADDAEVRLTAVSLIEFWNVGRMRAVRYGREGNSPAQIRKLIGKDVGAMSKLLRAGLEASTLFEPTKPRKAARRK
jgi:AcrR family transcriptional regulator